MNEQENTELLVRLDERQAAIDKKIDELTHKLDRLDGRYVSHAEFTPVRLIVYGLVACVLMAVIGALITLVVRSPHAMTSPAVSYYGRNMSATR